MKFNIWRLGRRLVGASLLCGSLTVGLVTTAHANYGLCLDDPIVHLADGTTVSLTSTIHTDASNVSAVTYNLVIPEDAVVQSIDDPGPLASVTTLHITNGDGSGYSAAVSVTSRTTVPFQARMDVTGAGGGDHGQGNGDHGRGNGDHGQGKGDQHDGRSSATASGFTNSGPVLLNLP